MKKVNGRAETINRSVSFKPGEVLPFPVWMMERLFSFFILTLC